LEPRLTDPAYNPHILDNHLTASATLRAYADLSSADLVPRTYEAPRRIAGLLVPLPDDEKDRPATRKKRKGGKKKRAKSQTAPADPPSASEEAPKPVPKPPIRKPRQRKPSN
jgi:hypothetical protein